MNVPGQQVGLFKLAGHLRDDVAELFSNRRKPRWLTKIFNSDARLQRAMSLLEQIPEGKKLLDFAREQNIRISMRPHLPSRGAYIARGFRNPDNPARIYLNSSFSVANIALALAHELRHAWQFDRLGLDDGHIKKLGGPLTLVFNRLIEGDANVFTRAMAAKLTQLTHAYMWPHAQRDLTEGESWSEAFAQFQQSAIGRRYDRMALRNLATHTSHDISSANQLPDFQRILVKGVNDNDPAYFRIVDNEQLARILLSEIAPDDIAVAELMPVLAPKPAA